MKQYKLENLDCPNCASKLEQGLRALDGVRYAGVSFASGILRIDCDDVRNLQADISAIEPGVRLVDTHTKNMKANNTHTQTPSSNVNKHSSALESNIYARLLAWMQSMKERFFTQELGFVLAISAIFLISIIIEYVYIHPLEASSPNDYRLWANILLCVHIMLYAIAAKKVFLRALHNARRKEFFDENVLMIGASLAAFSIGASEEAVGIMIFFSAGEYLQNISVKKGLESINALANLAPPKAHKIITYEPSLRDVEPLSSAPSLNNAPSSHSTSIAYSSILPHTQDIHAQELCVDDEILVLAGEVVPVDAMLLDECASFDTSAISGESLPVTLQQGKEILAGSIALHKPATLRAIRPYERSQIAKITELIENATAKKARTENFITSFARYYTPIVFFVALCIAFIPPLFAEGGFSHNIYEWVYRAIVVLMVSCPCALVISVPLGYFGGIVACSRASVLLKGSNYLEALSQLRVLGFDKTGTLTKGVFKVTDIVPQAGVSAREVLGFAACAQDLSNHPIAQSIKKAYTDMAHTHHISEFEEFSGLGVRAICDSREIIAGNDKILHKFAIPHDTCDIEGTIVHISVDKRYLGYIIIADELKPESKRVIKKLKARGITPFLLSGDGEYPCRVVGEGLGIAYHSGLLPQEKTAYFEQMKEKERGKMGFVGDGINDAPTLALADVGVAMGGGSDLSRQKADVIVLNNSLDSLLQAIAIARKTKIIIYENIALALGVKGLFIVFGVFGVASIWEAVFGDVGVALLALANAMRTMRYTQSS